LVESEEPGLSPLLEIRGIVVVLVPLPEERVLVAKDRVWLLLLNEGLSGEGSFEEGQAVV